MQSQIFADEFVMPFCLTESEDIKDVNTEIVDFLKKEIVRLKKLDPIQRRLICRLLKKLTRRKNV